MQLKSLLLIFISLLYPLQALAIEIPVFPGAVGFGTSTPAGSGRHKIVPQTSIYKITSLADSGRDTLRECVTGKGARTCIFEVSGVIQLGSQLEIKNPYITIAGQSAPGPGIMLVGAGLKIKTHDVLVQHLAIRVGDREQGPDPGQRDGVTIDGSKSEATNIVLDHLSVTWALDENIGTYGNKVSDVTISNTIIAEGLFHSNHPDGPHSMGVLIGDDSKRITIRDSLLAHNNARNPRIKSNTSIEFVNNLIYNWGGPGNSHIAAVSDYSKQNPETLLTFAGNYYAPGPDSTRRTALFGEPMSKNFRAFVKDNFGPTRMDDNEPDWKIAGIAESPFKASTPPVTSHQLEIRKPLDTFHHVIKNAGARPASRDSTDSRIVEEVKTTTGTLKDCVIGCERSAGGWPEYSFDRIARLLPMNPSRDKNGNGYTELEDWLHCMAKNVESEKQSVCGDYEYGVN